MVLLLHLSAVLEARSRSLASEAGLVGDAKIRGRSIDATAEPEAVCGKRAHLGAGCGEIRRVGERWRLVRVGVRL